MPSINQWGRENPDKVHYPEGAEFIAPSDVAAVQAAGYWGVTGDTTPRENYTVAGVTANELGVRRGLESDPDLGTPTRGSGAPDQEPATERRGKRAKVEDDDE